MTEVVRFEDTGEERTVAGRCRRCERTDVFLFHPDWRGAVVSPTGVMHVGVDYGRTACGRDATTPKWWWPS